MTIAFELIRTDLAILLNWTERIGVLLQRRKTVPSPDVPAAGSAPLSTSPEHSALFDAPSTKLFDQKSQCSGGTGRLERLLGRWLCLVQTSEHWAD